MLVYGNSFYVNIHFLHFKSLHFNRNTYSEGEMYFVMGRLTKVDSLGHYGSQYSHCSGHSGERGRDDFDDVSRTRESCITHVYSTIE